MAERNRKLEKELGGTAIKGSISQPDMTGHDIRILDVPLKNPDGEVIGRAKLHVKPSGEITVDAVLDG